MPVFRLHPELELFPHPLNADQSGILAVEGGLTAGRLINAYRHGIFHGSAKMSPFCGGFRILVVFWCPKI